MKGFGNDLTGCGNPSGNPLLLFAFFVLLCLILPGFCLNLNERDALFCLLRRVRKPVYYKIKFGAQVMELRRVLIRHRAPLQKGYPFLRLLVLKIAPAKLHQIVVGNLSFDRPLFVNADQFFIDPVHALQKGLLLGADPQGFHTVFLGLLIFLFLLVIHSRIFIGHIVGVAIFKHLLKTLGRKLLFSILPENLASVDQQADVLRQNLQKPVNPFCRLGPVPPASVIPGLFQFQVGMLHRKMF